MVDGDLRDHLVLGDGGGAGQQVHDAVGEREPAFGHSQPHGGGGQRLAAGVDQRPVVRLVRSPVVVEDGVAAAQDDEAVQFEFRVSCDGLDETQLGRTFGEPCAVSIGLRTTTSPRTPSMRGHVRVLQHPGDGELGHGQVQLVRDRHQPLDADENLFGHEPLDRGRSALLVRRP